MRDKTVHLRPQNQPGAGQERRNKIVHLMSNQLPKKSQERRAPKVHLTTRPLRRTGKDKGDVHLTHTLHPPPGQETQRPVIVLGTHRH